MDIVSGLKEKLTISDDTGFIFEAMINPAGYQHVSGIKYSTNKAAGPGAATKFNRTLDDKIVFKELVLDGTGVISSTPSVKTQIDNLRKATYAYKGSAHEPPIINVSWGPLLFQARLKSLTVDYTLFKPSGEPLRAKISLTFFVYRSTGEIFREAGLESPDLTHLVKVKAGDTLPMLCYQIYKDSAYYLAVARINNLRQFRHLEPGQTLRFPPLI